MGKTYNIGDKFVYDESLKPVWNDGSYWECVGQNLWCAKYKNGLPVINRELHNLDTENEERNVIDKYCLFIPARPNLILNVFRLWKT